MMKSFLTCTALSLLLAVSCGAAKQTTQKNTAKPSVENKCCAKQTKSGPQTGRIVVMQTNKGTIKIALYEKDAPITSGNFINLVNRKFYDGLTFHRVEPGFVVQGGDPNGDGSGGSDKTIKLEVSPKLKHDSAGVVAMARTPDPDSASSQFYITLAPASFLDMKYAVFGKVVKGMDVVNRLEKGDKMKTVRLAPRSRAKKDTVKK